MLNRIVLVGRLTRDPELKYTPNGVPVARMTLAVNRPFTDQQGERQADFINCVVWRRPAENAAQFLGKGSLVGIDGRLQTRSFDNHEGNRVYITEVVCDLVQYLESKNKKGERSTNDNQQYNQSSGFNDRNSQWNDVPGGNIDISDDDLPF